MRDLTRHVAEGIEREDQARELLRAEAMHHTFTEGRTPTLDEIAEFHRAIREASYRLGVEMTSGGRWRSV